MLKTDNKTIEDVRELLATAKANDLKVEFIEGERSGKLSYCSSAELYSVDSPARMCKELEDKLKNKGVNIYQTGFEVLKYYYEIING